MRSNGMDIWYSVIKYMYVYVCVFVKQSVLISVVWKGLVWWSGKWV